MLKPGGGVSHLNQAAMPCCLIIADCCRFSHDDCGVWACRGHGRPDSQSLGVVFPHPGLRAFEGCLHGLPAAPVPSRESVCTLSDETATLFIE
jgi:hypothetical protein